MQLTLLFIWILILPCGREWVNVSSGASPPGCVCICVCELMPLRVNFGGTVRRWNVLVVSGSTADTSGDMSIQVGSLLDDGQWHDVEVKRREENVSLTVDQLTMTNVSTSDFYQLDLDRKVHATIIIIVVLLSGFHTAELRWPPCSLSAACMLSMDGQPSRLTQPPASHGTRNYARKCLTLLSPHRHYILS